MKFRRIIRISLCSLILWTFSNSLQAQSRAQLEQQRFEIIERIDKADELLKEINSSRSATLKDLKTLDRKIKDRKSLVQTINKETKVSEQELKQIQSTNIELKQALDTLKIKYYKLLNAAYKQHLSYNKWAFILNAKSLNDSFQKWRYIKQYEIFCKESYQMLLDTKSEVEESTQEIANTIAERQSLLNQQSKQLKLLESEQYQMDRILRELKSDEKALNSQLADQKKRRETLNLAIENAIVSILKGDEIPTSNTILSSSFIKQKSKLSWPVDNGKVVSGFGKQRHPNLKDIMIENNGIDIQTRLGSAAYCIFDGEVVGVNKIPGYQNIVLVKHQNYYTVYSKLEKAYVSKGDQIKQGDRIGLIYLDEQGITTLHFEIWEGKLKKNPSSWLKNNI